MTTQHSLITIPGSLQADYDPITKQIVAWHFTPAAGDAGYFGPHAILDEGADPGPLTDDGPPSAFWQAVQVALAQVALADDLGIMEVQRATDGPDLAPFTDSSN